MTPAEREDNLAVMRARAEKAEAACAVYRQVLEDGVNLLDMDEADAYAWKEVADVVLRREESGPPLATVKEIADRDLLVGILADLFGWSDRSFLHAVMHIENAVKNLRADNAVLRAGHDWPKR